VEAAFPDAWLIVSTTASEPDAVAVTIALAIEAASASSGYPLEIAITTKSDRIAM